ILFLVIVVSGVIICYLKMRMKDHKKANLATTIPLVGMAIVELVITLVAIKEFSITDGVFEILLGSTYEEYKVTIGSSIIVFLIFSILLLLLNIAWIIVDKKVKDNKEAIANDL
ncbi:MAG: hypothetical protein K2N42_01210, partial [Anaeroplasmataceae bacterium]|nr:hypothetical protein [Anaeroplasmataceae bacterium]